ncbi:conserved hypothetical protein [Hahella chejuensis KCTC 2396]|uniref:DUF2784 domain-containing protein n=1 Tax=Hahella chejuensis (strain KCTC 2396) TaxID=349521 RepID=Q2SMD4_HAHCH|nr:DUF2784 domain-containing protein [Hahella chejuensis]ABC28190.1 conserved hypothetical protein [Hahella chejuensis KCTC 2396]
MPTQSELYQLLADAVLVLHVFVATFVIAGLVLILIGNWRHWSWVNGWWFRIAHLAAIAIVVAESWLGIACPLTTLEVWLREQANIGAYSGGFIEYWFQRLLFYDAPSWAFTLAYSLFGLAVVASWVYFPPGRKAHSPQSRHY